MNIAIPVFGNRVSPRFDSAAAFLLLRVVDGIVRERTERPMQGTQGWHRTELLTSDDVDVLLCGGIRRCDYFSIAEAGIEIYAGLMGEINDILEAFLRDEISKASSWAGPTPTRTKRRKRASGHCRNDQESGRRRGRGVDLPGLNRYDGTRRRK